MRRRVEGGRLLRVGVKVEEEGRLEALGPCYVAGAAAEGASGLPDRLVLEVADRVQGANHTRGARVGMEQVGVALRAVLAEQHGQQVDPVEAAVRGRCGLGLGEG